MHRCLYSAAMVTMLCTSTSIHSKCTISHLASLLSSTGGDIYQEDHAVSSVTPLLSTQSPRHYSTNDAENATQRPKKPPPCVRHKFSRDLINLMRIHSTPGNTEDWLIHIFSPEIKWEFNHLKEHKPANTSFLFHLSLFIPYNSSVIEHFRLLYHAQSDVANPSWRHQCCLMTTAMQCCQ